jgi:hypothetical protein
MKEKAKHLPYKTSPTFGKIHLLELPKCGAKRRGKDALCKAPAMVNGRCRLHGGKSTGPKTPQGKERSRRGNWQHGYYSQEAKEERRQVREMMKDFRRSLRGLLG